MTYAERIEAIARAIYQGIWERMSLAQRERLLETARVADAACLKAIEEPTRDMLMVTLRLVAEHTVETATGTVSNADMIYRAMHAAIPRGE